MLKLSNFPFSTLKTRPKVSDNISTSLLLQGSYIRQTMAGAYELLPMGYRVYKKIEEIIRQEMDNAGYHEMMMSILTPRDLWETTSRWEIPEYFKVPGWGTTEYRISPTAEENVTSIFKEYIESYKDLPTCVYQIQKKFRNEKRAKSGLLRGREFVMKDAYSFHSSLEDFEGFYTSVIEVYNKIFDKLGVGKDTVMADADGGAISDKNSHEFQTFLEIGEDIIVTDSSGYCYNLEIASGIPDDKNVDEKEEKIEIFESIPEIVTIEKMVEYFKAPAWKMLKTVVYKTAEGKYFSVMIRGDLEINEIKLGKFIRKKFGEEITQAPEEDLLDLGTVRGFVTPLKTSEIFSSDKFIGNFADLSLKTVKNFYAAANKLALSSKNVNVGDLQIDEFLDLNEPIEGFLSKNVAGEKLIFRRACEVGNIFYLGDKYTKSFGLSFLDKNNEMVNKVEMGCYGIGVTRLMGVLAEYFMTENGILWPENIAPYDYYILVLGEENLEKAVYLAKKLESEGKSVILDDRMGKKFGFGQKASDCELWGIPNRIVISPKTIENGGYELKTREKEEIISF